MALSEEMAALEATIDTLTARANPALRGMKGIGPGTASILLLAAGDNPERLKSDSAFAALCGFSPIEASSGKTTRHRLNRGGNRQANHAMWRIVMVRLTCDPDTKAYVTRRRAQGKTDRDILRCLKRYVAREVYRHLVSPASVPAGAELRITRLQAGLSLAAIAGRLHASINQISRLERAIVFDNDLATRYQSLLEQLTSHSLKKAPVAA